MWTGCFPQSKEEQSVSAKDVIHWELLTPEAFTKAFLRVPISGLLKDANSLSFSQKCQAGE